MYRVVWFLLAVANGYNVYKMILTDRRWKVRFAELGMPIPRTELILSHACKIMCAVVTAWLLAMVIFYKGD